MNRTIRAVILAATVYALATAAVVGVTRGAQDKVTVCHAAGRAGTTHFVTLSVPANDGGFPQGHFTEGGTTAAGHEEDYLGPCLPLATASPTPSVTATPSVEPSASPTPVAPTATPSASPTATPEASPTPSPDSSPTPTTNPSPSPQLTPLPSPVTTESLPPRSLPETDTETATGTSSGDALVIYLLFFAAGMLFWLALDARRR